MKLFHVSPAQHTESIRTHGLMVECSLGKIRGVWLVERQRLEWAWLHVAKHQNTDVENMVAYEVDVDKADLTYRGRRVWVSTYSIQPERIGSPFDHAYLVEARE